MRFGRTAALAAPILSALISFGQAHATTRPVPDPVTVTAADCNTSRLGTAIDPSLIGEPVTGVTLTNVLWVNATGTINAYCRVDGSMAPVDPNAPPILFRVVLPAVFTYRYVQQGGGGQNGSIPGEVIQATYINKGFASAGSDSGHQGTALSSWPNDEAMKNFGQFQMKKTHDAAQVLIKRMYGGSPVYSYWQGNSQGGREGMTVAQRYPKDFDGVMVTVPVVNFSSLTLGPELIRIQEKPLANWVTPAKTRAIATEVIRQCDGLDGLMDGVVNNYVSCRKIFDVREPPAGRQPWAAKRCPGGVDPNPADTTANACLTDGQIGTLQFMYSKYFFATPLAYNNTWFGMWLPNTDPAGSGQIATTRYVGQEGAAANAPVHSALGITSVLGWIFQNMSANPLDYVEGGVLNDRRVFISQFVDGDDPNLTPFYNNGGKLISVIGSNDTLASPAAQTDYYQAVIDLMGQDVVDRFARFYVLPGTGHGLNGNNYPTNGNGETIPTQAIPNSFDRVKIIIDWVENDIAPGKAHLVTSSTGSRPLCSYPLFPRYLGNGLPTTQASSFVCSYPAPTCADLTAAKLAVGARRGDARYNARFDMDGNGTVDIRDIAALARVLPTGSTCN